MTDGARPAVRLGIACAVLLVPAAAALAQEGFRPLRGPYMGQEAGDVPRLFLPGKIASGHDEGSCAFFPGARAFLWHRARGGAAMTRDGLEPETP